MATPIPTIVGDIICTRFSSWYNGQLGMNVKYGIVTAVAGPGGDLLTNTAKNLSNAYGAAIASCLTTPATYNGCRVTLYRAGLLLAEAINSTGSGPGAAGTQPLPTQVRGLCTLRTAYAGRKEVGRMYFPFPDQTAQDVGTEKPTAAYLTAMQSVTVMFITAWTSAGTGGTSSTYHFGNPDFSGPPKRPTALTRLFESSEAHFAWATQKRSGDYGKGNPDIIG